MTQHVWYSPELDEIHILNFDTENGFTSCKLLSAAGEEFRLFYIGVL